MLVLVMLAVDGKHGDPVVVCECGSHDTGFGVKVAAAGDGVPSENVARDRKFHESGLILLRMPRFGYACEVDAPLKLTEEPMEGFPPLGSNPKRVFAARDVVGEAMDRCSALQGKVCINGHTGLVIRIIGVHSLYFAEVFQHDAFEVGW